MANTSQKLIDSERRVVYKWTGNTAEPAVVKIDAGGLNFSLNANNQLLGTGTDRKQTYRLALKKVIYDVVAGQAGNGYVELYWTNGANTAQSVPIMNMDLCGQYSEEQGMVSIYNNANGATGDIGVRTFGMGYVANTAYTLFVELRKDNSTYQRGQLNDPAAFNYGPYSLKP